MINWQSIIDWSLQNTIGILGILIGGFIAYHIYFLSERLALKDKLIHRDNIRRRVEPILSEIRKGISRKCELINVRKYLTHYPNDNKFNRHGYTYIGAELKTLRYDGVEFFESIQELYKNSNGEWSLTGGDGWERCEDNVFIAGVIPYEWIEYVDAEGDEFSYRPQFFTRFKGGNRKHKGKFPYKYLTYYKESDTYVKGSDPIDMQWRKIEIKDTK
jgi:hypothetical protein